jgi:hypothetical protein
VPAAAFAYGRGVSIGVSVERLMTEVGQWGFGYLLTVSDDSRTHLVALRPLVAGDVLRFDAGGGRACRNAEARPQVSIVFPPGDHSDGFSLVVDGEATVEGDFVDVRPTSAVLHRPAP